MQFVWLILTLVEARSGGTEVIKEGEKTLVQCFVPAKPLETALEQLDAFLDTENYVRRDIQIASRYDRKDPDAEAWQGNLECVEQVARTGKPCFGVFVVCPEWTPSWQFKDEGIGKPWWKFWR